MSETGTGGAYDQTPQITEIDIQFQARATFLRLVVMRPGEYWNPDIGWEDIPADGYPTEDHKFTPTRFANVGPNTDLWTVKLPLDLEQMENASVRIYQASATGALNAAIGWYPIDIKPDPCGSEEGMYMLRDISFSGTISKP